MSSTDTTANVIHEAGRSLQRMRLLGGDARSVALAWLTAYAAGSAILLAMDGHLELVAVHVAVMVIAASVAVRKGGLTRATGDLLPLLVMPLLYGEIPLLIAAIGGGSSGGGYHDALVQRWEYTLFGTQPSQTLAGRIPWVGVSELLHAGYLAYYAAIFIPPLALFVHRERRALAETVAALTITYAICWAIFVLVPVEGPRYVWGANPTVPDGPIRRLTLHILAAGSARGAAFPSSHMAVTVVQMVLAFRWQRRVGWSLALVALLVGVGAVYGGFHYAIDIVVGAVLGGAIGLAVLSRYRKAPNE
jgi:PAP2 superfamily.